MDAGALKIHLLNSLRGKGAHPPHAAILSRIPAARAAEIPPGVTHSAFQLVEHMRLCIEDIVRYCRNADYVFHGMEALWPANPDGISEEKWEKVRAEFFRALNEMIGLVETGALDQRAPSGPPEHTLFREALIVVDHNSYHCGQLALIARFIETG